MSRDEVIKEETEREPETDFGTLVAKTTIRTVLSAAVCIVLIAALFVSFFPYSAMRLYVDFGNKNRALECAESFVRRERTKYVDTAPSLTSNYVSALYTGCELSVSLFNTAKDDGEKAERARQVKDMTSEYLSVPSISERNRLINENNIKKGGQPYYYHPSLYSYRDYLVRYNYVSGCVLGDRKNWIYAGSESNIDVFANMFYNIDFTPNANNIDEICEAFNMLSAMIAFDFDRAGVTDYLQRDENSLASITEIVRTEQTGWFAPLVERSGKTTLLTNIESRFIMLRDYALGMSVTDADTALHRLYVFRSLSNFAYSARAFLIALSPSEYYFGLDNNSYAFWNEACGGIQYEGYPWGMNDYYREVLLPHYLTFLV